MSLIKFVLIWLPKIRISDCEKTLFDMPVSCGMDLDNIYNWEVGKKVASVNARERNRRPGGTSVKHIVVGVYIGFIKTFTT